MKLSNYEREKLKGIAKILYQPITPEIAQFFFQKLAKLTKKPD